MYKKRFLGCRDSQRKSSRRSGEVIDGRQGLEEGDGQVSGEEMIKSVATLSPGMLYSLCQSNQ